MKNHHQIILLLFLAVSLSTVDGKLIKKVSLKKKNADKVPETDSSCHCGTKTRKRVVGGEEAEKNSFPWVAALYYNNGSHFCGGTLINEQYVLTAAHCFIGGQPLKYTGDVLVILGDHDTGIVDKGIERWMTVDKIYLHNGYKEQKNMDNDIALIHLVKPVEFTDHIQPICLPDKDYNQYIGQTAITTGWGMKKYKGKVSETLQEVDIPILEDKKCIKVLKRNFTKNMLCGGHLSGGKDACQGDSGGPLFLPDEDDVFTAIGIVSFGLGCAKKNAPSAYTKIVNFLPWMYEVLKTSKVCSKPPEKLPVSEPASSPIPARPLRYCGMKREMGNGKYPWSAEINLGNSQTEKNCNAVLINQSWLITTADCVNGLSLNSTVVRFGNNILIEGGISDVIHHPDYNENSELNNIALIRTSQPISFNNGINPVCLSQHNSLLLAHQSSLALANSFIKKLAIHNHVLSSYYRKSEYETPSYNYKAPSYYYETPSYNYEAPSYNYEIPSYNYETLYDYNCRHYKYDAIILCYETNCENNGELTFAKNSFYHLIGIGSGFRNRESCRKEQPSIYVNVNSYADWINNIINE